MRSKVNLNFQETVFPVEEIKQEPAEGEIAEAEDKFGPGFGEKAHNAAEEEIRHRVETQYSLPEVNGDRVHADNLEEQNALAPAFDIYEIVEYGEEAY